MFLKILLLISLRISMRMMVSEFLYHTNCPNCGSSDALGVFSDGHTYCFSCSKTSGRAYKAPPVAQRSEGNRVMWVPDDITTVMPFQAHEWLKKYQLTPKELIDNKVVWSEKMKLLIFLYSKHGILLGWQGRYFGKDTSKPKWWSQGNLKEMNYILTSKTPCTTLTLTEDIISSIKVSRICNSKPLYGSYINIPDILKVYKDNNYKDIKIWLDADKRKEAYKFSLKLNSLNIPTRVIYTTKDPKDYGTNDMEKFIAG